MEQVWFLFKLIETILGICCMTFHVKGFLETEPLVHNMFYCGTFFGFTIYAMFGNLSICIASGPTPFVEAVVNGFGALMYVVASMLTMYQAENDFHLMYLSDFEEPQHEFFHYSKSQSISALTAGSLHLLHSIFAFDIVLITPENCPPPVDDDEYDEATQPLKLYVFGKAFHKRLEEFKWFRFLSEKKITKPEVNDEEV